MIATQHAADVHGSGHESAGHERPDRPAYDDINVPVVVLIGVISTVITLVTIWFVEGIYHRWNNSVVQAVNYDVANFAQTEIVNQQKHLLEGDPAKGIASLESVIPEIVERYNKGATGGEAPESSGN